MVVAEHFHRFFDFPPLPYATARIVWAAKYRHMDVMLFETTVHIVEIHAPHTVLVKLERTVLNGVSCVLKCHGESHISGAVQQNLVSGSRKRRDGGHQSAEHAVLIADRLPRNIADAVAVALPAGDRIEILVAHLEISESRMLRALDNRLRNGGNRGEVHVGDPHGDHVEAGFWRIRSESWMGTQTIDGERVLAVPFHQRREIVGHSKLSLGVACGGVPEFQTLGNPNTLAVVGESRFARIADMSRDDKSCDDKARAAGRVMTRVTTIDDGRG